MTTQNTLASLSAVKPNTQANLQTAQQLQVQNGTKVNAALASPQPVNAPPPALTINETSGELRAFEGPFWGYTNFITRQGKAFTFYNGKLVTADSNVIAECANIPGVVEIQYHSGIELPPVRNQGRARSATPTLSGFSETTISPLELMTRAVGNSTHVPQAGDSTSTVPN